METKFWNWFLESRLSTTEILRSKRSFRELAKTIPFSDGDDWSFLDAERLSKLRQDWQTFAETPPAFDVISREQLQNKIGKDLGTYFPKYLSYVGNLDLLVFPKVAIIGSRHPTFYGREQCYRFAKTLAQNNVTILSGGAIGIDTVANNTGFQFGNSCAIVGGGILNRYPSTNEGLFSKMAINPNGLVVSEFGETERAQKWHFPKRNFTLAALADFILVIEAGRTSGTLITANAALENGVDVGAIPGPIDNETSDGTNRLIQNGAFCILNPEDVIERIETIGYVRSKFNSNRQDGVENLC